MPVRIPVPAPVTRAAAAAALALAAVILPVLLPGPASAGGSGPGQRALSVAAAKKGSPYRYGAAGPNRFDCSGLTMFAYRKAGKRLPRTVAAQYRSTRRLRPPQRRPGDLVFFPTRGGIFHVGIYAGRGRVWHAPRRGTTVRLDRIWTQRVRYGRVR